MRIRDHPILEFKRGKKIHFYFNGKKLYGYEGESISASIVANGIHVLSRSLRYKNPRGFFCGIGKCSSCLMNVNGIPNVRTCITPLKEGMEVRMQEGYADLPSVSFRGRKKKKIETDVLVIGAGPAGLTSAIEAAKQGVKVLLVDENPRIGGQLVKQTHKFFGSREEFAGKRGIEIADILGRKVQEDENIDVLLRTTAFGYYENGKDDFHLFGLVKRVDGEEEVYKVECKSAIFACGAMENMLVFPGNDLPGVYGAGGVQTLMNVYGILPGRKVLMVGSGNVGLIVSYQLLQAGAEVVCIIEAMPRIGGYHVHAAKVRRCGVPILTSHTIVEAKGKERVEGAVIGRIDEKWNVVKGSEREIECDTICLAVGLSPSIKLIAQTGAEVRFIPEAGGYVALHNKFMETTKKGIFVAGDASGVEEASIAIVEGKIAGFSAAKFSLGERVEERDIEKYLKRLNELRAGPFGERGRKAKEKILAMMERRRWDIRKAV